MRLRLGNPEHRQKRLARSHNRYVVFEHDQGIANRVDDTLSQLPVALALFPSCTFLADILDGEQNETIMITGTKNLPGIDQHCTPTNGRKIMLNLEPFYRCTMMNHALKQGAQRRDVPLPVSEVVDKTSLGLIGACANRVVERAIGRRDV